MQELLWDVLLDCIKLLPFLFFTYFIMEYLERKAGEKAAGLVRRAGKYGPLIGGILGAFPQCGFSVAASGLYAGRIITLGTLLAIYLSTSDEMLPILISEGQSFGLIGTILAGKILIGVTAGFAVDLPGRRRKSLLSENADGLCKPKEQQCCSCGGSIFAASLRHTAQIAVFIFLISLGLKLALYFAGEDALANLMLNRPVLGPILAGVVGLIPNCAASVAITQLFLNGVISTGSMMSGLLVGAGAGILVLFRVNRDKKENLRVIALLYGIGVLAGIVIDCVI